MSDSTSPQPNPRSPRYDSLTVWRGVACLLVVIFHSVHSVGYKFLEPGQDIVQRDEVLSWFYNFFLRFWVGVPLFFVISGYCITASADALRRKAAPGGQFFWRRFRRIYPPYWLWFTVVAVSVCVVEAYVSPGYFQSTIFPHPAKLTGWQWLGNLTLTENWLGYAIAGKETMLWGPAWTLCYEEQFYALAGLAMLCAGRRFFLVLTAITLVVAARIFWFPNWQHYFTGLFLDGRWLMFASGILVYYAVNYAPARWKLCFGLPLVLIALWQWVDSKHLLQPTYEVTQSYFAAYCFALLILFLHPWDSRLANARVLRPLRYCGEMCYSLYLVHWPVVVVVGRTCERIGLSSPLATLLITVPVCVAASVLIARLFHVWVERRFLNPQGSVSTREISSGPVAATST